MSEDRPYRFYVQSPHVDGLAVIDGKEKAMVLSSFGDTGEVARASLEALAKCLNAATSERWDHLPQDRPGWHRTDAFKAMNWVANGSIAWRAIEYLSFLYRQERTRSNEMEASLKLDCSRGSR